MKEGAIIGFAIWMAVGVLLAGLGVSAFFASVMTY